MSYYQETDGNLRISEDEMQIVQLIRNLKLKDNDLDNSIQLKEQERSELTEDIQNLQVRLKALNKSILRKRQMYEQYEQTLRDAESAYIKIQESGKTLLSVVRRELRQAKEKQ